MLRRLTRPWVPLQLGGLETGLASEKDGRQACQELLGPTGQGHAMSGCVPELEA